MAAWFTITTPMPLQSWTGAGLAPSSARTYGAAHEPPTRNARLYIPDSSVSSDHFPPGGGEHPVCDPERLVAPVQ